MPAPFALKADWAEHKTEIGAVAIGLDDVAALTAAFAEMTARLGHHGYVVEHMDTRPGAVELIVAARRDRAFGPVVVVGRGGVTAELDPDSALELAPCTRPAAEAMLRRLRIWPLLAGWRGRPGADIGGIVNVIASYAWHGHPGTVHSAAAKGGVLAMTRTLAAEWASRGVRVNCVAPGPTEAAEASAALWGTTADRDRVLASVPAGRFTAHDEVAEATLFLLEDRSRYITGDTLTIDGGQWLGRPVYGTGAAR